LITFIGKLFLCIIPSKKFLYLDSPSQIEFFFGEPIVREFGKNKNGSFAEIVPPVRFIFDGKILKINYGYYISTKRQQKKKKKQNSMVIFVLQLYKYY
jgi:hypothetical protein